MGIIEVVVGIAVKLISEVVVIHEFMVVHLPVSAAQGTGIMALIFKVTLFSSGNEQLEVVFVGQHFVIHNATQFCSVFDVLESWERSNSLLQVFQLFLIGEVFATGFVALVNLILEMQNAGLR